MANPFLTFHQSNLDAITSLWNQDSILNQFTYEGNVYNALISDVKILLDNKLGGFVETLASVIVVSKSLLAISPKSGQTVYVSGKEMRVHEVTNDEVSFTITCITASK